MIFSKKFIMAQALDANVWSLLVLFAEEGEVLQWLGRLRTCSPKISREIKCVRTKASFCHRGLISGSLLCKLVSSTSQLTVVFRECLPTAKDLKALMEQDVVVDLDCAGTLLDDDDVASIFCKSKKLSKLCLRHCVSLTEHSVFQIAAGCPALRHLHISHIETEEVLKDLDSCLLPSPTFLHQHRLLPSLVECCIAYPFKAQKQRQAPGPGCPTKLETLALSSSCWCADLARQAACACELQARADTHVELMDRQEARHVLTVLSTRGSFFHQVDATYEEWKLIWVMRRSKNVKKNKWEGLHFCKTWSASR